MYVCFSSLTTLRAGQKDAVIGILKALSTGFLSVIELQLKDFLPNGQYHAVDNPELRSTLEHSHLTNLVGEQAFGDLDFSMFKRRNATTHHHTSVNMLKRNKTLTGWFASLSPEQQGDALTKAAAKHQQLRKKSQQVEQQALMTRRQILESNRVKKEASDEKKRQQKINIIEHLKPHHGPCNSKADVQRLLRTYQRQGEKRLAIRAELQCHTVILGKRTSLLQVSKKLPQLVTNLKEFLGGEEGDAEGGDDAAAPAQGCCSPTPRKRPRLQVASENDNPSSESEHSEEEDEELGPSSESDP